MFLAVRSVVALSILCYAAQVEGVGQECEVRFEKVGCYEDNTNDRALKELVFTDRDKTHKTKFSGKRVDWKNWNAYLPDLACRCAKKANAMGFEYFSLQFWGECWSGSTLESKPTALTCYGEDFKSCASTDPDFECVGSHDTNFIYKIPIAPQPTTQAPTPHPTECKATFDLALAIDASGSVGKENYQNLKDFLKKFVSRFRVSNKGTHVALLHYDHRVYIDFDFADPEAKDVSACKQGIQRMSYTAGATLTQQALKEVKEKFFTAAGGARSNASRILCVMTDGRTYRGKSELVTPSDLLRDEGVDIFPVGIGSLIDKEELKYMVGRDKEDADEKIMVIDSFADIREKADKLVENMVKRACA